MRKQDWIANQLRRVYDEALQEDIPADMMALLAQLDETGERIDGAPEPDGTPGKEGGS
jgi:hypothetical protein